MLILLLSLLVLLHLLLLLYIIIIIMPLSPLLFINSIIYLFIISTQLRPPTRQLGLDCLAASQCVTAQSQLLPTLSTAQSLI